MNTLINLLITTNEPVLPTNMMVSPITIKSLEETQCLIPTLIKTLKGPGKALLIGLAAMLIVTALPPVSWVKLGRKIRREHY